MVEEEEVHLEEVLVPVDPHQVGLARLLVRLREVLLGGRELCAEAPHEGHHQAGFISVAPYSSISCSENRGCHLRRHRAPRRRHPGRRRRLSRRRRSTSR